MGPKVGLWWDNDLFWGWKAYRIERPNRPREKGPLARGRECANPLSITQEPPSCLWASLPLWAVSLVIYSSLPFILLLHLSVIHAYPQVHVPSTILSSALWAVVAPIALSKGHIHIKGGQGVSCAYLIRRWQLFVGLPATPPIPLWLAHMAWNLFGDPRVDVLGRCGSFFSHDFALPRIGSSSAVHFGSLDSLHSSPGTSSSSAWALGLRWNGPKPLGPSGLTEIKQWDSQNDYIDAWIKIIAYT